MMTWLRRASSDGIPRRAAIVALWLERSIARPSMLIRCFARDRLALRFFAFATPSPPSAAV